MHPLDELDFSTRVAKHAQNEAFSMTLVEDGLRVRNGSHAEPGDHEYRVTVDGRVPVACTCPADEHYEGACKHRVAVAIRRPVIDAASARQGRAEGILPDGGVEMALDDFVAASEDDGCEECSDSFPCWECVRTGEREMPE